jgi:pimeloyl-ACP methyl ester carboxylesterase
MNLKETLLLIHGGPGMDDSYFFPYVEGLKLRYDVKSYTLGSSYPKGKDYTIDSLICELNNVIDKIEGEITLLGHSFGACLALSIRKDLASRVKHFYLCNWIYDSTWVERFYNNHPETKLFSTTSDLKESSLRYLPYYFEKVEIGNEVLQAISYNDKLQNDLSGYLGSLDLDRLVSENKDKITSITSDNDKVSPHEYITIITSKYKIKNILISGAGHFSFIDNRKDFCDAILKR